MERKPRNLPPEVREALAIDDYATRHAALSAIGRKGAEARKIKKEGSELMEDAAKAIQEMREEATPPSRDLITDDGDVIPNPDYRA